MVMAVVLASCRPGRPRNEPAPRGPSTITPRAEGFSFGPYGIDGAECAAYVYTWDPARPSCRLQLNHCGRDRRTNEVVCLSLADERTVACGGSFDACGQRVSCACPTGAPEAVPEVPGTVAIRPPPAQDRWTGESSGMRCEASLSEIPGTRDSGLPPLCVVAIHECPPGEACIDRTEMLSCRGRGTICGRPVRCECGT